MSDSLLMLWLVVCMLCLGIIQCGETVPGEAVPDTTEAVTTVEGNPEIVPPTAPIQPPAAPARPPSRPLSPVEPVPPPKNANNEPIDCLAKSRACTALTRNHSCSTRGIFEFRLNIFSEDRSCNDVAGFCPRVDEFAAMVPKGQGGNSIAVCGQHQDIYMQAFTGSSITRNNPDDPSPTMGHPFPFLLHSAEACANDEVWIPDGVVLFNLTLEDGGFIYRNVTENNVTTVYKVGTDFVPTCGETTGCELNAYAKCAGALKGVHFGFCGQCVTLEEALDQAFASPVVFVSYYGTDNAGRRLKSGNKNPLNFRKYSMNNVYRQVSTATTKFKDQFTGVSDMFTTWKKNWLG